MLTDLGFHTRLDPFRVALGLLWTAYQQQLDWLSQ